ncbi:MAG TPA: hypothetical protein DEP57_01110 [Selenomonas sp.]|nr:hypothetical protein [Selenomonas sp.]
MATIDRFRDMLKQGKLPKEQGGQALTPQTKYDFLAAVHTMDQIEKLAEALESRAKKRDSLRKKFEETSRNAIKGFLEKDDAFSNSKNLASVVKILITCHNEFLKMEGEEQEDKALGKLIQDGITAK